MKGISHLSRLPVLFATILVFAFPAQAYFEFNQQADNQRYDLGYYFAVTGGKFPGNDVPNGDDASGGTFRRLCDDPTWGSWILPLDQWHKDDWFGQNAGLALTLKNGNVVVYDNNGIEDNSGVDYYNYSGAECDGNWPGVYQGYSMANNWDLIYVTYFKLAQETAFDTIVGYFVPTPTDIANFDPHSPSISYRMNIWSSIQDDPNGRPNSYIPAVASFTGDVFTTHTTRGVFKASATGVDIVYPYCPDNPYIPTGVDPVWQLVLKLRDPLTLPAGVYFFSHDAIVVTPVRIDIKPGSGSNIIDLKSTGLVPVAVLTTSEFKAARVDTSTVVFAGATPVSWTMKDVDHDGDIDKLLYFKVSDLMLDETTTEAILTGFTKEGIPIKGTDKVTIAPGIRIRF